MVGSLIHSKCCLSIIWSVGIDIYTFESGNFSCTRALKFRSLCNISIDVERQVSFVPTCTMIYDQASFGVTEWYDDSNHQPFYLKNFQP